MKCFFYYFNNIAAQAQGDLRLIFNGEVKSQSGRVEIFLEDSWGTICDPGQGSVAPTVVCRQLGYDSALRSGSDLGSVGS